MGVLVKGLQGALPFQDKHLHVNNKIYIQLYNTRIRQNPMF